MSFKSSLCAFVIVILVIIILFLSLQVQNNLNSNKESRETDQDKIKETARLIIESVTQNHPVLKYRNAVISEMILKGVIDNNGGMIKTEKSLKLKPSDLENLKNQINNQVMESQDLLTSYLIEKEPEYDFGSINKMAGLRKRPPKRESRKSRAN
jgi:hypothetical protein